MTSYNGLNFKTEMALLEPRPSGKWRSCSDIYNGCKKLLIIILANKIKEHLCEMPTLKKAIVNIIDLL